MLTFRNRSLSITGANIQFAMRANYSTSSDHAFGNQNNHLDVRFPKEPPQTRVQMHRR